MLLLGGLIVVVCDIVDVVGLAIVTKRLTNHASKLTI